MIHPVNSDAAYKAAQDHARTMFPEESCGFILEDETGFRYLPLINIAEDPEKHFRIAVDDYLQHAHELRVIVHSHPNGPLFPSEADMRSQVESEKVWAIIPLDEHRMGDPVIWGADTPIAPVLGRSFCHGVADCFTLVRDVFRLGRYELAAQGISGWPFEPVDVPEVPRNDGWWSAGQDLYMTESRSRGWILIPREEARPGDGFIASIRSDVPNHAGLLLADGTILHHLPGRLSRREPAGLWARQAAHWMRYIGDAK